MRLLLVILGFCCHFLCFDQSYLSKEQKIDSLKSVIESDTLSKFKVDACYKWFRLIRQDDFQKAMELNHEIIRRSENELRSDTSAESVRLFSMLIARSYNDIGMMYSSRSNYPAALDNYRESLRRTEELNFLIGQSYTLNNYATVLTRQGKYAEALETYNRCIDIAKSIQDTVGLSSGYANRGLIYLYQGDLAKAEFQFHKGIEFYDHVGDLEGKATTLANLGVLEQDRRHYKKSIEYLKTALTIQRELSHKIGIALSLYNLAKAYIKTKNFRQAESCLEESLEIASNNMDPSGQARALNNFGVIHRLIGDSLQILGNSEEVELNYQKAQNFFMKSKAIADTISFGGQIRENSRQLFKLYAHNSKTEESVDELFRLIDSRKNSLSLNILTLSEEQKEIYFSTATEDFELLYDFTVSQHKNFPELADRSYDNSLDSKGFLLKSSTAMRNTILNNPDSMILAKYDRWIALKRKLVQSYSKGGDSDSLSRLAHDLELELVKKSNDIAQLEELSRISWKDVQSSLSAKEIAVEFVRFEHQNRYRSDAHYTTRYCALIVTEDCSHPIVVDLFDEEDLVEIIDSFPGNDLNYINQIYGTESNSRSDLYNLIWKPVKEAAGEFDRAFVSPVGLLHKISFAALSVSSGIFLCDQSDIEIKSSTTRLALKGKSDDWQSLPTMIFGGIQYDTDSSQTKIWEYLHGSELEAAEISKILSRDKKKVRHFSSIEATEHEFKRNVSAVGIVHVATHGFFYEDPLKLRANTSEDSELNESLEFRGGRSAVGIQNFVLNPNPLMRSGLVLAGANDVWNVNSLEGEDGVLTAAEVATLDMRNTQLVVLSACETGLGDIKGSEGVYGLQRSFKMAGVKYLIMSLWQVPDKETAEFMRTFYKNLTESNDIKKAFKDTQLEMRKKYDPYYWGAFVLIE